MRIQEDLHTHSSFSDGSDSIADMLRSAKELGCKTIAISDHAAGWEIANKSHPFFPTVHVFESYLLEIQRWKAYYQTQGMEVLSALEIEVFSDTTLNIDPGIKEWASGSRTNNFGVDLLIGAVHPESFDEEMSRKRVSDLTAKAQLLVQSHIAVIQNPALKILAHPAQAVWGCFSRDYFDYELDILTDALKTRLRSSSSFAIEINCKKRRSSSGQCVGVLSDLKFLRAAQACGAKFIISSDAHATEQLSNIETEWIKYFPVTPNDIVNWAELSACKNHHHE